MHTLSELCGIQIIARNCRTNRKQNKTSTLILVSAACLASSPLLRMVFGLAESQFLQGVGS